MGSLGSSKRLPTAAEPALRPMGAVPRGAEDTCLPPELFVAHHAALAPQQGWLLAPRGVHCPGRPCLVAEAVTQCHGAALRRHRVLLPDLQHAWTCLAVCFALVCHQKKKSGRGKIAAVAGCLPRPQQHGPAAALLAGAALSSPQSGAGSREAFRWGESQPSAARKGCLWDVFACSTALSLSFAECKTPWKICWPLVLNSLVITSQATTNSNPWFLLKRTRVSSFLAA